MDTIKNTIGSESTEDEVLKVSYEIIETTIDTLAKAELLLKELIGREKANRRVVRITDVYHDSTTLNIIPPFPNSVVTKEAGGLLDCFRSLFSFNK